MIVLSGKRRERVTEQAAQLLELIRHSDGRDSDLANIAYTLQVGRQAMEHRLAIVASSLRELEDKLARFVAGNTEIEDLYCGVVRQGQSSGGDPRVNGWLAAEAIAA